MSNTSLLGSFGGLGDSSLMFRNRIINGDMRIDQRSAGANLSLGAATEGYPVDRFLVTRSGGTATLSTIRQVTTISGATNFEANSAPAGFTHALKVQIGTAQAVGTVNETEIKSSLEGFNGADWGWGTADAKPITLSFWVKSSQTGNFGVGMRSATFNYSIVASYTINAANTWEYKTVTFTAPTSGTFYQDTRVHHTLYWDLGVGSTLSTSTLNTWQSADLRGGLTGGVKLAETAGATFYITGVQIEVGSVATSFERRPYSVEESLCMRYYEKGEQLGNIYTFRSGDNVYLGRIVFKVKKRVIPTMSMAAVTNTQPGGLAINAITSAVGSDVDGWQVSAVGSAGGLVAQTANTGGTWQASAEV